MKYIQRTLESQLKLAAKQFPSILLTGPRRAGKTTLLRHLAPKASHVLLESPDVVAQVRSDPNGFLDSLSFPVVLDEIQNTPELFAYIRARIDRQPRKMGQWLITGSQEAPLMQGVSESMAGRAAVFQLLPFSRSESPRVSVFRGGFPEVIQRPKAADIWFRSYIQTYLERDVRSVTSIRDLSTFRRFLALLASRCGQILNRTDMAAPLGVSVPTISQWLSILEITGQILLVPPFYENFGKRIMKSPKLYFMDTGLLCHLLGIANEKSLGESVFLGPVFESFVASEIVKLQIHSGRSKSLYFFRDLKGLEVDFLVPLGDRRVVLLEAKATKTPNPNMAKPADRLAASMKGYDAKSYVVCKAHTKENLYPGLTPQTKIAALDDLADVLGY
ncbi:MAG: ATP-binding protein [Candidatus Hydrogenedentes bacterium]|nr:ATP-binding protein [Candidatus Hydrogenedentota bacterium]